MILAEALSCSRVGGVCTKPAAGCSGSTASAVRGADGGSVHPGRPGLDLPAPARSHLCGSRACTSCSAPALARALLMRTSRAKSWYSVREARGAAGLAALDLLGLTALDLAGLAARVRLGEEPGRAVRCVVLERGA